MKRVRAAAATAVTAATALAASLALVPASAGAQSVLTRTPNLSGAWVGLPSTLHLNLLNRFDAADVPFREVENSPTVFLGWGVDGYALLGVHWASASNLVAGRSDEWEVLGRFSPLSTEVGAPVEIGLTGAWNDAAGSLDGELSVVLPAGPLEMTGVLRGFSDAFGDEEHRWALGVGATLDLTEEVALAADVVRPTDLRDHEAFAWGGALQMAVPHTSSSLSLHVTNTNTATLQASSIRSSGTRFGAELTVSVEPGRWFGEGGGRGEDPGSRAGETELVAGDTVRIDLLDDAFDEERVVVRPGTYVIWANRGEGIHNVTAESGAWESPLMAPGESFGRVFTSVGEHPYHCRLHPAVRGTVVVEGGGRR